MWTHWTSAEINVPTEWDASLSLIMETVSVVEIAVSSLKIAQRCDIVRTKKKLVGQRTENVLILAVSV